MKKEYPAQERLIGGARQNFHDEWGMDERQAA